MRAIEKIKKYEERLRAWKKADDNNDPTVHRPTYSEFGICSTAEIWAAKAVEERVMGK